MNAVILAAGMGNRMKELTENIPKTLISIRGKPIIFYILENLSKQKIRNVIIVTGFKAEKIRKAVGNGKRWHLDVKYVHNKKYDITNNIYSIFLVREHVKSDFLIINSDVFFHEKILEKIVKDSKERGIFLMVDTDKELGEEEMKVIIKGRFIKDISKEIPPKIADGEYIGIARIDAEYTNVFFECVKEVLDEKGSGVFYEEAFKKFIEKEDSLRYITTCGHAWIEIDTPEDLRRAEEEIAPKIFRI